MIHGLPGVGGVGGRVEERIDNKRVKCPALFGGQVSGQGLTVPYLDIVGVWSTSPPNPLRREMLRLIVCGL